MPPKSTAPQADLFGLALAPEPAAKKDKRRKPDAQHNAAPAVAVQAVIIRPYKATKDDRDKWVTWIMHDLDY